MNYKFTQEFVYVLIYSIAQYWRGCDSTNPRNLTHEVAISSSNPTVHPLNAIGRCNPLVTRAVYDSSVITTTSLQNKLFQYEWLHNCLHNINRLQEAIYSNLDFPYLDKFARRTPAELDGLCQQCIELTGLNMQVKLGVSTAIPNILIKYQRMADLIDQFVTILRCIIQTPYGDHMEYFIDALTENNFYMVKPVDQEFTGVSIVEKFPIEEQQQMEQLQLEQRQLDQRQLEQRQLEQLQMEQQQTVQQHMETVVTPPDQPQAEVVLGDLTEMGEPSSRKPELFQLFK